MQNTFTGLVRQCTNAGIHAVVDEMMAFRMQLVKRPERASLSGWNDALNFFLLQQLEKIRRTVARVTYAPSSSNPEEVRQLRMAQAGDVNVTLGALHNDGAVHYDDIMLATRERVREFPYDFTGADPNFPQPTPELFPNHWLRTFIIELDAIVVGLTRLDSRHEPGTINQYESAQVTMMLQGLHTLALEKGGAYNRNDIPDGVTPLEEKATFNYAGQYDVGAGYAPSGPVAANASVVGNTVVRPVTAPTVTPTPPQPLTPPTPVSATATSIPGSR